MRCRGHSSHYCRTRAILLYIESVKDARKFMSAARAAARAKPVLVVKSGRHAAGAKAAMTHTGALAGSDAVYDAAFRRAGFIRALDLDELFAAAETLGHLSSNVSSNVSSDGGGLAGERLAILTNGGGIGVLAVDRLADLGGTLAEISPPALKNLDAALPPIWSHANPIDISGDADAARYAVALEHLLTDEANDAVLVMNVPTALASAADAAHAVVAATKEHRRKIVPPKPVSSRSGSAAASACRKSSTAPAFPITRPRLRPSPASCIWCNTANRAGS
jgi:acetyltransferase